MRNAHGRGDRGSSIQDKCVVEVKRLQETSGAETCGKVPGSLGVILPGMTLNLKDMFIDVK